MTQIVRAFLRRDWLVARSYPLPFALMGVQLVIGLLFIFYLARIVDDSKLGGEVAGLQSGYFAFAVIGFSSLSLVESAVLSFAKRIRTSQTAGVLETLMAAPLPHWLLLLGTASYDVLYGVGLVAAHLTLAVTAFGLDVELGLEGILALLVTYPALLGLSMAGGVLVAAFAIVYKDPTSLVSLGTAALGVLAGVWFPTEVLPGAVQTFSDAIPLKWANDIIRSAIAGNAVPWELVALLVGATMVALPVALWTFSRAVNSARRAGTLGQY